MSFELILVALFLVANLVIGIFFSKDTKNIKEYALGGRNFTTGTMAATMIATWIGGDNFALYLTETYKNGLSFVLSAVAGSCAFLLIAYYFAPRIKEFLGNVSIAEAMGGMYGREVRILSALAGYMLEACLIAFQFKLSSDLLTHLFGISSTYSTIAVCIVVMVYTGLGGIKAVTFTDIIQFFTFATIVPMVVYTIWDASGGGDKVYETVTTNPIFDPGLLFDHKSPGFWNFVMLFIFYLVPGFSPSVFQRISMSKNIKQITHAFVISAAAILIIQLLICMLAVMLLAENPGLDPNGLFAYVIENHSYSGLRPLIIIGVLSMIMSSVDSGLNSSSVMLTHDFFRPLGIFKKVDEIFVSRIALVITGAVSVMLALGSESLFELFMRGYTFYMPVVSVPFILAMMGFRTSRYVILVGMAAGFLTTLIWPMLETALDECVIPGFIVNLVVLQVLHYLTGAQGGWIGIKDSSYLEEAKLDRKKKWLKFCKEVKNFNLIEYFVNTSPKRDSTYTLFGVFGIVLVYSSMYTVDSSVRAEHGTLLTLIYQTVLIFSSIFLTYQIWSDIFSSKKVISILWVLGLFYILSFVGTVQLILSNFDPFHLISFMLSLVLMAILVRWQLALILIFTGVVLAINVVQAYLGIDDLGQTIGGSIQLKIVYLLLLVSSVLIAFLRPKQEEERISEAKIDFLGHKVSIREEEVSKLQQLKNEFICNLNHEIHAPMTGITSLGQTLRDSYDFLSEEQKKQAIGDIADSSYRLDSLMSSITDLSKLSSLTYELELEKVDIAELTRERIEVFKRLFLDDSVEPLFKLNFKGDYLIKCDRYYITQLLDNLISNSISYGQGREIIITIENYNNCIEFSISDQGIGIPEEELYDIFGAFNVSSRTKSKAGGRGIGLTLCKKVVDVHKGKIWAENNPERGATFTFIIPIK